MIHDLFRVVRGGQHVQIPHSFLAAAEASRNLKPFDIPTSFQMVQEGLEVLAGNGKLEPMHAGGMGLDHLKDTGFGFLAESRQGTQATILGGTVKLFKIVDIQLVVKDPDPLGSQSGDMQKIGHGSGQAFAKTIEHGTFAGANDFLDLCGQVFSNAWKAGQVVTTPAYNRDVLGQIPNDAGSIAIGPDAEGIASFYFQQIGNLVKHVCDIFIDHGHFTRLP
jgi:hypothetical protein